MIELIKLIYFVTIFFSFYVVFMGLYQVLLGSWGYGKVEKDYGSHKPTLRFLVLVCAHNEEAVIASSLADLKKIKYQDNLFDIVVIADNCSDNTISEVQKENVSYVDTSLKKFEREGVGKPAGIQYSLRDIGFDTIKANYDYIMVLDADNHVDEDILTELNNQALHKYMPEAIQSFLDSKNTSSMLAYGYAISYFFSNRFFQLSKYRLGLMNSIGGTGFIVRADYLINKGGFVFDSLTEDLQLSIEIAKDDGRILWNHHVKVYDEKPDELMISIRQRTRWAQGHWYVAFTNSFDLVKAMFKTKSYKKKLVLFDQLMYLFSMGKPALMASLLLLFGACIVGKFFTPFDFRLGAFGLTAWSLLFGMTTLGWILFFYQFIVMFMYAIRVESGKKIPFWRMFVSISYYSMTYMYTQFIGLFKWRQQGVWVKTIHKHTEMKRK